MLKSKSVKICVRMVLPAVILAGACARPAAGQLYQNLPAVSTLNASNSSDVPLGYTRDVIAGNNTRGPYGLSWKNISSTRETVVIDGRRALRGIDYGVDYAKGLISFTSILKPTSIAMVEYPIDAGKSTRNAQGFGIPLALDIYSTDRSNVQFTALYKQPTTSQANPGIAILGIKGNTMLSSKSKVASAFYLAPSSAGTSGGLLDRAAGKIEGSAVLGGGLTLTNSFIHTGRSFAASTDYGFKAGQDIENFGLAWAPKGGHLALSSAYEHINTDDQAGTNTSAVWQHKLTYNVTPVSQLLFSRRIADRNLYAASSSITTDLYQFGSQLGQKTDAVFSWTNQTSEAVGVNQCTSTQLLKVNSTLLTNTSVKAAFQRTASDTVGDSSSVDVGLTSKPIKQIEVAASFAGRGSDAAGSDNTGAVRLTALPAPSLKVSTGLSDRRAGTVGIRSHDVRVDAQPLKALSVTGGYALSNTGSAVTVIKDVAASAKPFTFLNIGGNYKTRDFGSETLDTSSLSISMEPWEFLGVIAAIDENPENSRGDAQRFDTRSLGLRANMGIVSLTGDYAFKNEYLIQRQWFQTRLGLGLMVARATQLTSGYEYSQTNSMGLSNRKVSVGVKRDLGSNFNLLLTGARIDTTDNTPTASQQTRYEAEMRLGVKF